MSLLFNMLFRFVRAFLPRSKSLLILWLQSPSTVILESKKIKSVTVSIVSPSIYHEVMGPDVMILVFWMLSFKSAFSLIKRLFSSSSIYAIRVESYVYLMLFIFCSSLLRLFCSSLLSIYKVYKYICLHILNLGKICKRKHLNLPFYCPDFNIHFAKEGKHQETLGSIEKKRVCFYLLMYQIAIKEQKLNLW